MRELPYMKSAVMLERNLHLDQIYERANSYNKQNAQFATKAIKQQNQNVEGGT